MILRIFGRAEGRRWRCWRSARRDDFEPLHEIGLPGMCTESAGRLDLRLHHDILVKHSSDFLAVHKPPPKRSVALIANDEDVGVGVPKIRVKVVNDSARIAQPAPAMTRHSPRRSLIARDSFAVAVGLSVFRCWRAGHSRM